MKKENYYKKDLKQLKKIAWKLRSEVVRRKSGGICYTCGLRKDWKQMDCGHCIHSGKGRNWLLDQNEKNLRSQCTSCNQFKSGNLSIYIHNLQQEYGFEVLDELLQLKHRLYIPTKEEVVDTIFKLKEELEELKKLN